MSLLKDAEHLKIPLEEIKMATNNFSQQNLIRTIDFGYEYRGKLSRFKGQSVVVKRLDSSVAGHSENEFLTEIMVLYYYRNDNLVSLVGFCNEVDEKIIVYEHQTHGSLDNHLSSMNLTWMQRLQICFGAASGLRYLHHDDVGSKDRVLHRDIRSSNILLNDEFEAKISGLELSTINPANKQFRFLISRARGAVGYIDPQYIKTGTVNDKSDVYSFGVVLFEVLCGRMSLIPNSEEELRFLPRLAQRSYEEGKLDEIIHQELRKQMDPNSLKAFSDLAYHCLKEQRGQRPNMDQVVKRLEKAFQLQQEFEKPAGRQQVGGLSNEYSNSQDTPENHYKVKNLEHLRIPLKDIKSATGDFDKKNHIGDGGYGSVYKAELFHFDERNLVEEKGALALSMKELCAKPKRCSTVAIKRLVRTKYGQGEKEFLTEIEMLSCYKHPNLVSLLGFCDEGDELIVVYEYASNGSLDTYLGKEISLTWTRRLQICLDAAHGLNYLHTGVGEKYRIIHRDVKSSNILLGQNWEAKISDFGLSRISPANQQATFLMIDVAGTLEYLDPQYLDTRRLTKASDVFSFGVVLFEVLSGRLAFEEENDDKLFLAHLAQRCFEQEKLDEIIDPKLREEMEQNFSILDAGAERDSLNTFSEIAYQCLQENQSERPTMAEVIRQLEKALEFQVKRVEVLKISLEKIKSATNNFSEHNLIGRGGFGRVYMGELSLPGCNTVAVKRLDSKLGQGKIEFLREITMLYYEQLRRRK